VARQADGRDEKTRFLAGAWWLHPLLLSAFPIIFLFASNIGEQVSLAPIGPPLAIALLVAAGAVVAVAIVARTTGASAARMALLISLLIVLFFSYGHVWSLVAPMLELHRFLLSAWLLGGWAIVVAGPRQVATATAFLNVIGAILLVVNLLPVIRFGLASGQPVGQDLPSAVPTAGAAVAEDRDVWYLVFDRYAGEDGLTATYGFDNRPFLDELARRGFQLVEHATANYLKTALSIDSTLSMDYLDADALTEAAASPDDWSPLYRDLQGSTAVERFLHARGYEYLHLGVRRGATYTNSAADQVFLYGDSSEFSAVLADTTLLVALEHLGTNEPTGLRGLYGHQSLYQFDVLDQLARTDAPQPRFVFAHFLLPHPPYVFNADGSWVTEAQESSRSGEASYLEQVRFVNNRILRLLDAIESRPESERPIILIQADEGPFPDRYAADEEGFRWTEATDEELLRKFSILSAYRVPGPPGDALELTDRTTPVNSFRAIFNAAFGAGFDLLDDRNLVFVDQRHIYDMVDVTDRVQALP